MGLPRGFLIASVIIVVGVILMGIFVTIVVMS